MKYITPDPNVAGTPIVFGAGTVAPTDPVHLTNRRIARGLENLVTRMGETSPSVFICVKTWLETDWRKLKAHGGA